MIIPLLNKGPGERIVLDQTPWLRIPLHLSGQVQRRMQICSLLNEVKDQEGPLTQDADIRIIGSGITGGLTLLIFIPYAIRGQCSRRGQCAEAG